MKKMVRIKNELISLGYEGWIHPHYELLVAGEMDTQIKRLERGEGAALKIENDYFKEHYKHICESDAVLVVNDEKNGVKNYIGGNVLIELGQAYVHNKKIFFLNGITADVPYLDEIIALQPICLEGDLQTINNRSY